MEAYFLWPPALRGGYAIYGSWIMIHRRNTNATFLQGTSTFPQNWKEEFKPTKLWIPQNRGSWLVNIDIGKKKTLIRRNIIQPLLFSNPKVCWKIRVGIQRLRLLFSRFHVFDTFELWRHTVRGVFVFIKAKGSHCDRPIILLFAFIVRTSIIFSNK